MTTISVPIPASMEESINNLIKSGYGSNKADVIRRSLSKTIEDEAIMDVLKAQKEIEEGKGLKGDLRELIKTIK
jgi:Arc/MetJ-type ribon-helix-helix transcriptional regulator